MPTSILIPKDYHEKPVAIQDNRLFEIRAFYNPVGRTFLLLFRNRSTEEEFVVGPIPRDSLSVLEAMAKDLVWMKGQYYPIG